MVRYFCAWKDSKGVDHPTEKEALEAEAKYELERKKEARRQKIIYDFRSFINDSEIPHFRSYSDRHPYYRIEEHNREILIDWMIRNEDMIRLVLNGKT